jgi:hypothetical protein
MRIPSLQARIRREQEQSMPCSVPATSTSYRRRKHRLSSNPPTFAATLDLSKPGEAWAEDYLRRASTGKDAFWRVLAIRRDDTSLLVAVQWLRWKGKDRYYVVSLSLTEQALTWKPYQTAKAAREALATIDQTPTAQASESTSRTGEGA